MIVLKLMGGIGNQMFEYAAGYALAKRLGANLLLDSRELDTNNSRRYELDIFPAVQNNECDKRLVRRLSGLPEPFVRRKIRKLRGRPFIPPSSAVVEDFRLCYDSALDILSDASRDYYIDGYWQNVKHFASCEDDLRRIFTFNESRFSERVWRYKAILNSDANSVAVHIRRGDYLHNKKTTTIHGLCRQDYYQAAMAEMIRRVPNATFYVLSDQPELARHILPDSFKYVIVDGCPDDLPYEDMFLMSQAGHNIIANSSYSWWGAWLNRAPGKTVIAPGRWYLADEFEAGAKDIAPDSWIRVGGCS